MPRYIDADALLNKVERYFAGLPIVMHHDMVEYIENAPTADVVEVVRCKDCAYKQYYFTNDMVKCGCGNGTHHEDFFCADGERREYVEETDLPHKAS